MERGTQAAFISKGYILMPVLAMEWPSRLKIDILGVCVCVYMSVCVQVHIHELVWTPEENLRCHSLEHFLPPLIDETSH